MLKNILLVALISVIAFYAGYLFKGDTDLYTAVENHPRNALDIPAQWLMMDTLVGWEKMMLVVGYADNVSVCLLLSEVAKEDSPDRNFRCTDAN